MNPIIQVADVWKSFKTVQAMRGINLRISPAEFVALLGPNDAGNRRATPSPGPGHCHDSALGVMAFQFHPLTLTGTRYIDFLVPGLVAMGIMML